MKSCGKKNKGNIKVTITKNKQIQHGIIYRRVALKILKPSSLSHQNLGKTCCG